MTNESWLRARLGDLGGKHLIRTGPYGSELRAVDYVNGGVPVIMPKDLRDGVIDTTNIARVASSKAEQLARYQVEPGDIVLARRGEMGRCALIGSDAEGWLCGTGCLRIRPRGQVDARYLLQVLRWKETVAWLADHAVGQTMPSLNTRILADLPLSLPSASEQRRIVDALVSTARSIARARAVMEQTRRVRIASFRRLLTLGPGLDFLARTSNAFLPERWPSRAVGSLCRLSNGRPFRTDERSRDGLPIIRIRNLNGSTRFNYWDGRPEPAWTVERGDLLFAWAGVKGSSFGPRLWLGPRGVLNQHIFRVDPRVGVVKAWLFEALNLATEEIVDHAQGFKDSLLHLRKRDLTEHRVRVPPRQVQQWIAEQSRALAELEAVERSTFEGLTRLRLGLTDDLLGGRVRTC
ncbi:MAG: hypothetical protein GY719_31915 [bacterium]|nr:hypothetical protein [bacterium]